MSAKPRILLVDDDPAMLLLVGRFLQEQVPGSTLLKAPSGEDGLRMLKDQPVDLVLSDYRMGLVNGTDVLAFALQHQPTAIRVLMSGYGDPKMIAAARQRAQIHEFVEKPVAIDELEANLQAQVVDRHLVGRPAVR